MALPRITGECGIVSDPEIRFSQSGKAWAKVRVVFKDRKRDSNGEWVDGDPSFLDVVCFGKYAENLVESVAKGDTIYVDGRLSSSKWEDKEGNQRESWQVTADEVAVSLRWTPARTERVAGSSAVTAVKDALGATEMQPEEAPF